VDRLYQGQSVLLSVTLNTSLLERNFNVTIENYNAIFNCHFHINRSVLTQILHDSYQSEQTIVSVKYEPSTYQGVIVKYVSRVLCHSKCTSDGKKSKCGCKEISFFIFQGGNVIVTGGRCWEQQVDGCEIVKHILSREFKRISVRPSDGSKQSVATTTGNLDIVEDGQRVVLLDIEHKILENPRTMYLMKINDIKFQ
jgi:TATA-box binding protein (TBP) (component of TFIID and TFIIIB)